MKIQLGLAQIQSHPACIEQNKNTILSAMDQAEEDQLDMLVFPESCLPGYLLGDMWERNAFLLDLEADTRQLIKRSQKTVTAFGTIITDWKHKGEDGRPRKYNAVVLAQNGEAIKDPGTGNFFFIKSLLPNYREFDDSRHFFDLRKLALERGVSPESLQSPVQIHTRRGSFKLGVTLCEDGWSEDYHHKPFQILAEKGARLILNLSCSPYTLGKRSKRHRVFSNQARHYQIPIAYINSTGLQNNGKTIYTFDGDSAIYDLDGVIKFEAPPFQSKIFISEVSIPQAKPKFTNPTPIESSKRSVHSLLSKNKYKEISDALLFGSKEFMSQCNLDKVVIGLSGGIDSAVTAALYGKILPPQNLLLVNMPSQYNSSTTISLARTMSANLGCFYTEISIQESIQLTQKQLLNIPITSSDGSLSTHLPLSSFHLENIQARDRGSRLLAALAAQFGGVFSCNANKAEMTVGYSTLYGDLCGFLAIIGDLWKEEVYALGQHLNQYVYKKEIIPNGCFTITPSAELSSQHNVEEGQGDPLVYPYHDKLFFSWVQKWQRDTPEDTLTKFLSGQLASYLGCEPKLIDTLFPTPGHFISDLERWWNLYNGVGVVKRVQAPPVLAISSRSFGFDHREHIGIPFYSKKYKELKKAALR